MKAAEFTETMTISAVGSYGQTMLENAANNLIRLGEYWADAPNGNIVIKDPQQYLFGLIKLTPATSTSFTLSDLKAIGKFEPKETKIGSMLELEVISNIPVQAGNFYNMMNMIWTIKEHIGIPIIDSGVQSTLGQQFVKAVHKSGRYDVKWYNIDTGKTEPYENSSDKYGVTKTKWRTMIEHAITPNFSQKGLLENEFTSACMWNIFEERQEK